jgi:hypothetical protein
MRHPVYPMRKGIIGIVTTWVLHVFKTVFWKISNIYKTKMNPHLVLTTTYLW